MKKSWVIIALSFVLIGLIVFGGAMSMLGWNFNKLSINKYETNTHEISGEFKNISIVTKTADVTFEKSKSDKTSVVCYEPANTKHNIAVKEDTLWVEIVDTRKWYEYISFSFKMPKITVYLPNDKYDALSIDASTGDIKIPNNFTFDNINIISLTGDVKCKASTVNDLNVKLTTGDIELENLTADNITLAITTGDVEVCDVKCSSLTSNGSTGDIELENVDAGKKFYITRSTGDVKLDGCDADELFIETDTGDVSGSLLTSKVFICKSDTGKVVVPHTTEGGKCEITTDTGNIKMKVRLTINNGYFIR